MAPRATHASVAAVKQNVKNGARRAARLVLAAVLLGPLLLPLTGWSIAGEDMPPPLITAAPQPLAVAAGSRATFSVAASGAGQLAYQWQRDGVPIFGANGDHYSTAPVRAADHGVRYRVLISNAGGVVSSAPVPLQVSTH